MVKPLLVPQDAAALAANNFDALRLFMALLVVWSHCFALWYGTEAFEPVSLLLGGAYNAGNVAVLGFFTISGFLITMSYARSSSWARYLMRRVRRIYPGYLVALLFCSLVVVPAFSSRAFGQVTAAEWGGIASNLLLRGYILPSDAFGGGAVNGALWSIPYEFWCYLGVLALGLAGLIHRRLLWVALTLAVMLGRLALDLAGWRPSGGLLGVIVGYPPFWFLVAPSFLIGALIYQYRKIIPRSSPLLAGLLLATVASAHLLPAPHLAHLLLPPTLAYLLFYLAFAPWLRLHKAARFGDFSYGTYLYGFPIQRMLVATLKGIVPFAIFVPIALLSALAMAVLSWHLVEKWFVRKAAAKADRHVLGGESVIVAP